MASLNSLENTSRKNMYGPILVGLALVVAIFVAKPQYDSYADLGVSTSNLEIQKEKLQNELASLKKVQKKYTTESGSGATASIVAKIAQDFENSEILDAVMINSFTKEPVAGFSNSPEIIITNVSVDAGQKLPNGLFQGRINLWISSKTIDSIVDYLSYITAETGYAFTLDTINLPIDTDNSINADDSDISMSVTLGVYYLP